MPNFKKLFFISITALFAPLAVCSQSLLPQPKTVKYGKGHFVIGGKHAVTIYNKVANDHGEEYYRLHVTADTLAVYYGGEAGKYYARQTLEQLKKDNHLPVCDIEDWPSYPWRGCMIDVSRHFFPVEFLMKQVDVLSHYKINRLHIHLTDAGGWRLQIDRYPLLTQKAAWRTESDWRKWWSEGDRRYLSEGAEGAYGGYYTKDDMRNLIAYAQSRGITVVPEIEMPGHSDEVTEAYPELKCEGNNGAQGDLCPSNEATYVFLKNVLDEVIDVFPSRWIHIGGDEAGKGSWAKCPRCQAKAGALGLQSVADLQGYLIQRVAEYMRSRGREVIGWDEILDDRLRETSPSLGDNVNVMVWRSLDAAHRAISRGHNVILTPGEYYVNRYQDAPPTQPYAGGGYESMEQLWNNVNPSDFDRPGAKARVMGVQGNLWTEYIATPEYAEYMLYPRLLAIGEVGWSGRKRSYGEIHSALCAQHRWLTDHHANAFDLSKAVGDRKEKTHIDRHLALGAKVIYNKPWSPKYPGKGASTLTDGYGGGWAYGDGAWQGFLQTADTATFPLDLTVDLGSVKTFKSVSLDFVDYPEAWIYTPADIEISISDNNADFTPIYRKQQAERGNPNVYDIVNSQCRGSWRARYVRIKAKVAKEGEWLFTDEIKIGG